ncbi:phosphoribosylformylglycinamidine synthase subunit PurS [Acanthopleuribacter pedis]
MFHGVFMKKVRVIVRLRSGVLDPQGKTAEHALNALGYEDVKDVRIGKVIELQVDTALEGEALNARVGEMCDKLLANPVIEDYEILEG